MASSDSLSSDSDRYYDNLKKTLGHVSRLLVSTERKLERVTSNMRILDLSAVVVGSLSTSSALLYPLLPSIVPWSNIGFATGLSLIQALREGYANRTQAKRLALEEKRKRLLDLKNRIHFALNMKTDDSISREDRIDEIEDRYREVLEMV